MANGDFSEENQELFNIRQAKAFNLFEGDKEPIQDTLIPENGLFRKDTLDPYSVLLGQGNKRSNPCTLSQPEEEIQALLEEILEENPWDNRAISQPQASTTHQEVLPLFIQEFKRNWNIKPQVPHVEVKIHETSNCEVTFSKEMNKQPFEGILKKEDDENQP
ncbi:hypothetical protein O181_009510 [Austropuccinia psidii MF-1]|uniref:Uncharacterized protein n=1 Tax=Austropuccinia psidii MF-1 TaxID=1389203 RepID=A0A9Q3GJZ9_9BASI|nr:hypothetical protein [Austropuccinia psidii MF-1]